MSFCNRLHVIFESCENQEGRSHTARPYGLTKPEIARISFRSLWVALSNSQFPEWRLAAYDNGSSEEFKAWMHKHSWAFLAPDGVPVHPVKDGKRSLADALRIVDTMDPHDEDWVLIAEDDQVWAGDALYLIRDFINTYSGDFVLVPYVQPYLVWSGLQERQCGAQFEVVVDGVGEVPRLDLARAFKSEKPRVVLRSRLHHWMQVFWANGTIIVKLSMLRAWCAEGGYSHEFVERKLATTVPGFAPIPSLSTHFQEGCESPGFNQRITEEWVRGFLR